MKALISRGLCVIALMSLAGCKWFSCCCHEHGTKATVATTDESFVVKVTSLEDFETKVINATKPVVIDFNASWCGPCRQMKPIFHATAKELGNKYLFVDIDVDAAGEVAQKYEIRGVPTFVFMKDGKEIKRITGASDKNTFIKNITDTLGN